MIFALQKSDRKISVSVRKYKFATKETCNNKLLTINQTRG